MCEHQDHIQRIAYAFEEMRGTGIIDMPRLKNLLNQTINHEKEHG